MKLKHALAVAGLALLAGCTAITPVEKQYSGYLGDYSQLKPVKTADGSEARRWINPELKKDVYKKVIVPSVVFFPAPRPSAQVRLENLNKVGQYLTEKLRQELGKSFEVTDVAGPDTLNLQIAITGVATPLEGLKAYETIPIAMAFAGASTVMGYRDKVIVVYVEGLVTDSVTGQELGKSVRQGVGENLQDDKQQLDVEKLKALLDSWAVEVAKVADEQF